MSAKHAPDVPPHLAALFVPGVTGATKLLAAWDGLSDETKILALHKLKAGETGWPDYCDQQIRERAFGSTNAYVRYLAFQGLYLRGDERQAALTARMDADPSDLVRFANLENSEPPRVFRRPWPRN